MFELFFFRFICQKHAPCRSEGGRGARSEIFWGWGAARGSFLTLIDNKVPAFFSRIVACFSADRGRSGGFRVALQHK